MTVTVKREDYEALQKARLRADRAVSLAKVAVMIAVLGLVVAGYGFFDYFSKQNAEVKADAQQTCDNAVINRQVARESDFGGTAYVDEKFAIVIDYFGGVTPELQALLDAQSADRYDDINRARPPLDPDTCPPVPMAPPTITPPVSTSTPPTSTVAD